LNEPLEETADDVHNDSISDNLSAVTIAALDWFNQAPSSCSPAPFLWAPASSPANDAGFNAPN